MKSRTLEDRFWSKVRMVSKGRQCRGMALPHTKLTDRQRRQVIALIRRGVRQREIAARFGITQSSVSKIKSKVAI